MTKNDFFRVIIKLFGLYWIIKFIFSGLPANIIWSVQMLDAAAAVWIAVTILVAVAVFVLLIYNAGTIVKWFRLDKGFDDERIDYKSFDSENILSLALILIGGVLIIQNIPVFLSNTLFAFKSSVQPDYLSDRIIKFNDSSDYINWTVSFLNLVIGYLILTNYHSLSRRFSKKKKTHSVSSEI